MSCLIVSAFGDVVCLFVGVGGIWSLSYVAVGLCSLLPFVV